MSDKKAFEGKASFFGKYLRLKKNFMLIFNLFHNNYLEIFRNSLQEKKKLYQFFFY